MYSLDTSSRESRISDTAIMDTLRKMEGGRKGGREEGRKRRRREEERKGGRMRRRKEERGMEACNVMLKGWWV